MIAISGKNWCPAASVWLLVFCLLFCMGADGRLTERPFVEFDESGTPVVGLGVRIGVSNLTFEAKTPFVLHTGRSDDKTSIRLPEGAYRVKTSSFSPGAVDHYLVVDSFDYTVSESRIESAVSKWKKRGFDSVRTQVTGLVLGIQGDIVDTRKRLVVIGGFERRKKTESLLEKIRRNYATHVRQREVIVQPPEAKIVIESLESSHRFRVDDMARLTKADREPVFEIKAVPRAYDKRTESLDFSGELVFRPEKGGGVTAINRISVEEILKGVVPAEIYSSAPKDALRAQAVAARTNIFDSLTELQSSTYYLMRADVGDQVYKGIDKKHPRTTAAVEATRGQVLGRSQQIVQAPYSSNAGGLTENVEAVWNISPKKHLKSRVDMPSAVKIPSYLKDGLKNSSEVERFINSDLAGFASQSPLPSSRYYRWKQRISRRQLLKSLRGAGFEFERIDGIEAQNRGPGGRINHLVIETDQSLLDIKGELKIRRLFGGLPSSLAVFEVKRNREGKLEYIQFRGAGFGHGVGMCQTGAAGMAAKGYRYREILSHYYRGTNVLELY